MPETIPTINTALIDVGRAVVSTSPRLNPPEWTDQPLLYLDRIDLVAGPQIDQAQLSWRYGSIKPTDIPGAPPDNDFTTFPQLDIIGHFVRVQLLAVDGGEILTWYGQIESEANDVRGLSTTLGVSTGEQQFLAYGLLRLLERVYFRSTLKYRDPTETEPITIARGIPFNMSVNGDYAETGNRSANVSSGGTYLFSDAPELADEWTAYQAAEYLLKNHSPVDGNDNPIATWQLDGDSAILDWYIIHTRTEGRSVKELLDELIPRKRAVGYWVDYNEDTATVYINLFSLNGSDLVLPTGTIPANPNQYELDFERAISIERALLRNVVTTTYDRIVARGEHRTSTCTLSFNPQYPELEKAWTADQEDSYLEAASNKVGYGALSLLEKYRANAIARSKDTFEPVFRRFQISNDWTERARTLFQNEDTREWHVVPLLDTDGVPRAEYDAGDNPDGETIWPKTLLFNRFLALRSNRDYSDDRIETGAFADELDEDTQAVDTVQYLRPMFFAYDSIDSRYEFLDQLAIGSAFESAVRPWSIQPEILPRGPVVDLKVIGGPQQFIADSYWGTAAVTDPEHDPNKNGGLDYDTFYATLTIDTGVPVEHEIILSGETGKQQRTLYIDVPDARLDYVVPYTVVALNDDPGVAQTTTGGFIRDDRERLELIAKSAAAWYGMLRQTLQLSFRKISSFAPLGSLIVAIPSAYQREEVNTVITRISYRFDDRKNATTEIETSFAEFELL